MRWLGLLPLLCVLGCDDPVQGDLLVTSANGHSFRFAPNACIDGNDRGFFGVEFKDEDHQMLDFHRRGDAPAVIFFSPGRTAFELDDSDCSLLDGDLERKFNRVTDNGKVSGTLELSCRASNNWTIEGTLTFEDCRAPDDDDCDEHSH